ncbi:MAG: menaquinone biosynthesis decarboxylase [Acidobacteria bacterium]|nr:MAG: menaquinone biosynthesis decarboxylase [Acidobacteriota bacterium]
MAYRDLREFIDRLESEGELRRIKVPVDPELEIAEITDRVSKQFGPALLFENVQGSGIPLLINAFGSSRRTNIALETPTLDDLAQRVSELLELKAPEGLLDKIRMLPRLADLASFFPRTVSSGPCQEVVETSAPSLAAFPIIKCWPADAGRYITMGCVFTRNPLTARRNCGMYRLQVFDERTLGMHWQIHKHGAWHYREGEAKRQRIEVCIAIGADPATVFSAIVPLPDDIDEMIFAGFIRRKPVDMVKCRTVDLEAPASAEIVLEGYVEPHERRLEGPFGDHTGFYSLEGEFPVFHLTAVTYRRDPIYQTTIVGRPPMEDCHMGKAVERIFLPVIRKQLPEIVDIELPWAGIFHNLVVVSIRKRYPGHARKIMNAIWGLGQMMFSKVIIVVDEDVNVHDPQEVAWKALNHIDPERDTQFVLGPVDQLDHSARLENFGSKMGVDATRKWPSEGFNRPWPDEIRMSPQVVEKVSRRWKEYGL